MTTHDRSRPPSDAELRHRLGASHAAFRALLDRHPDLVPEWKWYGQKNGWSLKLLEGKRNLCFVTPAEGHFTVGFTYGHDAVERALASDLPSGVRSTIADAHTYAEGRPFRLEVRSEDELEAVDGLIEIKRGPRRKMAAPAPSRDVKGREFDSLAPARTSVPVQPARRAPSQRRGRSPG